MYGYYYKKQSDEQRTVQRTSRVRLFVLTLLVSISVTFGAMMHAYASNESMARAVQDAPQSGAAYVSHAVRSGESLWSIARQYASPRQDLRECVEHIRLANKLSGSLLQEGQLLLVPLP